MQHVTRRAAITFMAIGLGMSGAQAKDDVRPIPDARNLTAEPAQPVEASTPIRSPRAVHVSLMPVGPSAIAIGTPLGFRMVSTADGFGSLYVLSASGRTQVWFENIRLRAGTPMAYPRRGLTIRATAPAGDETLLFVAARDRLEGLTGPRQVTNPLELQYTHDGLRAAIQQKFGDLKRERWAFAEIKIHVHD
jgi:hypothetical protein